MHDHMSADHDIGGVQKFHQSAVPRVGGVALLMGVAVAVATRFFVNIPVAQFAALLLVTALPVFLIGLLEDLTKSVGVKSRFFGALVSAALAGFLFNTWLVNVEVPGVDALLALPVISILFTCFAVAGVTNAFNIIDGYHGLVSVVACIILTAIAYVAFQVHDVAVMACAFAAIGAALGFLIWNYPKGLIFLGDGGAYLLGFWVAELSVLLVVRNDAISKWFPVLICIYPIFETIFTMYRRFFLKKRHVSLPDAIHLHQLIYRRVVRWSVGSDDERLLNQRNSLTSPYLWALATLAVIPAVLFWQNRVVLQSAILVFALSYLWLYLRIMKFRVPKWLILNRKP
jgi:UDP-N-acetylmuramyl pentapeptide phosphotransferase/UDP-N-acetylglucosamine-1-phosphate transferase